MSAIAADFSERLFDAVDRIDIDAFMTFLADDVTVRFANNPPVTGREAVEKMVRASTANTYRQKHTVLNEFRDGDALVQQLSVRIVLNNGAAGQLPGVNVLRFNDDGLIYDYSVYIDMTSVKSVLPEVPEWTDSRTLEPAQLLAAFSTAVNTRDEPTINKLVAPDYLQHTRTIPDGRDSVEDYHTRLFERWPDFYVEVSNVLQQGNLVSAFSRIVLTEELGVETANVWLIRDGQLAEHWEVADTRGAFDDLAEER